MEAGLVGWFVCWRTSVGRAGLQGGLAGGWSRGGIHHRVHSCRHARCRPVTLKGDEMTISKIHYLVVDTKVMEGLVGAGENVGLGLVGTGENDGLVGRGFISLITLSPVIKVGYVGLGFISLKKGNF